MWGWDPSMFRVAKNDGNKEKCPIKVLLKENMCKKIKYSCWILHNKQAKIRSQNMANRLWHKPWDAWCSCWVWCTRHRPTHSKSFEVLSSDNSHSNGFGRKGLLWEALVRSGFNLNTGNEKINLSSALRTCVLAVICPRACEVGEVSIGMIA